jgi:spore maturation protein CgeB
MKKNLLFIHPLRGNAHELYKALGRNLNLKVTHLKDTAKSQTLLDKIKFKLKIPSDIYSYNKQLKNYNLNNIDIVFIVKGNEIYPSTLKKIKVNFPHIKFINWSQDDMYAWHNRSLYYTFSLRYYDLVVTQKSYNIVELQNLGAKRVLFQNKAYSKELHKSYQVDFKYDVLFIGAAEKERIDSLNYLAQNGIKIIIFGGGWNKVDKTLLHKNLYINEHDLVGENYAKALSSAKISLCFLRKINRDLQTSRSIEIPACKGFMIAERTDEHLKLFEEDKEAVYFSDNDELLKKVQYYLKNSKERENIRENGYKRCMNSNYSYDDRVNEIIEKVFSLDE